MQKNTTSETQRLEKTVLRNLPNKYNIAMDPQH